MQDNILAENMTLRDYFAAQALGGILACFREYSGADRTKTRVQLAYEYADEMIKQRQESR